MTFACRKNHIALFGREKRIKIGLVRISGLQDSFILITLYRVSSFYTHYKYHIKCIFGQMILLHHFVLHESLLASFKLFSSLYSNSIFKWKNHCTRFNFCQIQNSWELIIGKIMPWTAHLSSTAFNAAFVFGETKVYLTMNTGKKVRGTNGWIPKVQIYIAIVLSCPLIGC